MYYIYLIICLRNKKLISYVGYTSNIRKRINLHNKSKGAKFTRGSIWKLAYLKKYNSRKIAMKEEYKLKKNQKLRNMIKKNFVLNTLKLKLNENG